MKFLQILTFISLFAITRPVFAMNLTLGSDQQLNTELSSQESWLISGAMPVSGPAPLLFPLGGQIEVPPLVFPDGGSIINPPAQTIVPDTGNIILFPIFGGLALAGIVALLFLDSSSSGSSVPSIQTPPPLIPETIPPIQEVPEPSSLAGLMVFSGCLVFLYRLRK